MVLSALIIESGIKKNTIKNKHKMFVKGVKGMNKLNIRVINLKYI